jgi:uncharacterized protein (TIGR03032 family)
MENQETPKLEITSSRLFMSWLSSQNASLAFTTYQAGKLFLIGTNHDGSMSIFERTFNRSMGLSVAKGQLWLSSLYQLWRFQDFLEPGQLSDGYDALYVPVAGHTTGDIDIHDIHVKEENNPVFVATRFNCLATLGSKYSFEPVWRPHFIDRIAAEDRCHLNGMAVEDDQPRYVTCVAHSNIAEGWRDHRADGGLVIDVETNDIVSSGLSMPHSPRLYNGKLWILQAGTGEFGFIDKESGQFEAVCFLPGFARGLSFIGDYAVIGLSKPRYNKTFNGLLLNERLDSEGAQAKCAVYVINLTTGDIEHMLDIEGVVEELYDVAVIPDVKRPKALGFKSDEIRFAVRPEAEI